MRSWAEVALCPRGAATPLESAFHMLSPAREAAYRILRQVEEGRFAADLLQTSRVSRMIEADRNLANELVMGTLRWQGILDFWLERLSGKPLKYFDPEILTVLRLGIYQIRLLQRIPKSAAVDEAVKMAKAARKTSAARLVNAVLRKCERESAFVASEGASPPDELEPETALRALPAWLAERWKLIFGEQVAVALARASLRVPPVALRIASKAAERDSFQEALAQKGLPTRKGAYSTGTLIVETGSSGLLKEVRDGALMIQDEASQIAGSLLLPRVGDRVLDLCAAPGIKTGRIAGELRHGMLVACDVSEQRLRTMRQLLSRQVPPSVKVHPVRLDASRDLPFGVQFDRILLDAPCSGTGTLGRNPEIKWRLRLEDIVRLAEIQARMLEGALRVLTPGGRLVYVTCSMEREENEGVVENVLFRHPEFRLLGSGELLQTFPLLSPFIDVRGYFHTRPDLHFMDGFFAATIVRS